MMPTTENIISDRPYTRPRVSSVESSAMNAWKLGPTNENAIALPMVAISSHCHDGATIKTT